MINKVIEDVEKEMERAVALHGPMHSAHEGYAIIAEEFEELWEHVKTNQKRRDLVKMREEAIQVAAMAARFAHDICDGGRGRA